ncbi:MAG TPA: DNRLRE domain-containing protein, partial [Actinomycetota bacterium]|nr:DNRLRE domain-containing protein [Actinomycetota bacterium]
MPVQPGMAQPEQGEGGVPESAGPPAKLPPGPTESARHSEEGRPPEPQGEAHGGKPAAPLGAQSGPDASVRGLSEAAELRGPSARFFEDEGHEPHVVQLYTDPINYRDENGEWQPIDSSVVATEGGYTNAANSFDLFFPGTLTPANPVVLDFPEGSLSFALIGGQPAEAVASTHSVTYEGAHPHVDVAFDVAADGVKERTILRTSEAPEVLRYLIQTKGVTLSEGAAGSIAIARGGTTFGHIPPAFAFDSGTDGETREPATTFDVAMNLRNRGPGAYTLELRVDSRWLNDPERVFPVTVDPSVSTRCNNYPEPCPEDHGAPLIKDTFVRDGLNTRQDSAPYLHVGRTGGGDNRAFMTFDVRQEIRKIGDLIYDAKFDINVDDSWSAGAAPLELRRITQDWDAATTWEYARPDVHSKVWAQDDGCSAMGCKDGWTQWDVSDLMQYWIDTKVLSNHGWELSVSSSSPHAWKTYVSGDYANADRRPHVNVWVNAMPGTKEFAMDDADWPKLELAWEAIPNSTVLEIDRPKLEIRDLIDKNGDRIFVRYQVSKNPAGSFGSGIEYDSGWIEEKHSLRVPSGYLAEGTHYWRVMAGDACPEKYKDPDEPPLGNGLYICDDLGADNTRAVTTNERPISEVRSFTIRDHGKGLGKDPRWAMWSKPLGNGMQLSVNQSNGNAVLEYAIDSLGTSEAPVKVGLTHNTHQAMRVQASKEQAVAGLPPGWEIAAGPAADPQQMPVRIKRLSYTTFTGTVTYGVAVVYESGKRDVLIDTGDGVFSMAGPLAPTVRSNGTAGWTMTTYSGGTYTFSAAGALTKARPSSSRPGMPGFDYTYVDGRIRHLVDPVGRKLTFNYEIPAGGTKSLLKEVVAFDDQTDPSSKLVWTIDYENERIVSIKDPENGTVKLAYDPSERLSKIYDAVQAAATAPLPTAIEYDTTVFGTDRAAVTKVALPSVDVVPPEDQRSSSDPYATSPSTPRWEFSYTKATSNANYSKETKTTGPRGVLTSDVEDHMVVTDFNDIGLPIMERGPRIGGEFGGWPVTEKVWDFETGNLVCHRGPAANKIASVACGSSDGLQTQYEYQKRAPYLLTKVTSASDEPNGARLVTTYGYDEGFSGLQAHYYKNNTLTGIPDAIGTVSTVSENWGEGGPSQIDNDSDFSVRFFGEWKPPNATQAKDYQFRVTGEDEARLIVGKEILVDCISVGVLRKCPTGTQNTVTAKTVGPAAVPIVVELRAATGPAHVKLEWKRPDGVFEIVPSSALSSATDARTSEKVGTVAAPGAFSTRTYEYATGESKVRRLPTRVELTGGPETPRTVAQSASYTYDDHGRIKTETDATGRDVVHSYDVHGPCEHTTTDRVDLVTTRVCNLAGDVLSETVHVGGVTVNGSTDVEQRTTTTTYTSLGRVDRIDFADGGYVDHDYDLAGRLVKKTVLQSAGGMMRETEYVRNAQGWVTEERLPDPDGTGP